MSIPTFCFKTYLNGEVVRLLLRRKNLRQKTCARKLRISQAHFYKLLEARCSISPALLAGLCVLLDLSEPALITRQDAERAS